MSTPSRGRPAKYQVGRKVGKLTLRQRLENAGLRANWLCECECGNFAEADSRDLDRWQETASCSRGTTLHRMTDVDPETKIGNCAVHGPRTPGYWYASLGIWTCASKRADDRKLALYGLNVADWDAMFEAQDRVCAICKGDTTGARGWATDHNHETGKVRGILCSNCNVGLGMFRDDCAILAAACTYLQVTNHQKEAP